MASEKTKDQIIYTYDLSRLKSADKVRAVYALKGRGREKGLVESMNGRFLAPGCFMLPEKNDKEMQEIMARWSIRFKRMRVELR